MAIKDRLTVTSQERCQAVQADCGGDCNPEVLCRGFNGGVAEDREGVVNPGAGEGWGAVVISSFGG